MGGDSYLLKSTDGGQHFFPLDGAPNHDVRQISFFRYGGTLALFVGSDGGLFVSFDLGNSWHSLNNRSVSLLYGLAVDGTNLIAPAQDFSPLYSNDTGGNWFVFFDNLGIGEGGSTAVDPYNSSIVVVWNANIAYSHDGGRTFQSATVNFSDSANLYAQTAGAIAYSPNGDIFVAGGKGVLESTDQGATWTLLEGSPVDSFVVAVSSNSGFLYVSNESGLYESASGITWTQLSTISFASLATDPEKPEILVGIPCSLNNSARGQTVMITTDGGLMWQQTQMSAQIFLPQLLYVHMGVVYFQEVLGKATIVYVGAPGIFVSFDLGKTWNDVSFGVAKDAAVTAFAEDSQGYYVSTYGSGVWFNPNLFNSTEMTSNPLLTGLAQANSQVSIDGTPLPTTSGYFEVRLTPGLHMISDVDGGVETSRQINATSGTVYFINLSSLLAAPTLTAAPSVVDLGQTCDLTSTIVTTGTSPYTYQWYVSYNSSAYSGISGATSSAYSFVTSLSNASGTYSFILQVTDSTGTAVNSTSVLVTVNTPSPTPAPSSSPMPTPTATPTPIPTSTPTTIQSPSPSPAPAIPEFHSQGLLVALVAFITCSTLLAIFARKKRMNNGGRPQQSARGAS